MALLYIGVLSTSNAFAFLSPSHKKVASLSQSNKSIAEQYKERLRVPMNQQPGAFTDYDMDIIYSPYPSKQYQPYPAYTDNDQTYYLHSYGEKESSYHSIVDSDDNHTYRYYALPTYQPSQKKKVAQLEKRPSPSVINHSRTYPLFFDQ